MTNHIQHTKLPHRQNCNTFFETMKSTLKKSCSIRPFKVDSLFCIQKNCSLYAGARKIKHGLGKKHGLYLSKSHIYITLVDKFFINLHRKMTLKFPIMGKLLDHKGWLQNTMKNFKCIFLSSYWMDFQSEKRSEFRKMRAIYSVCCCLGHNKTYACRDTKQTINVKRPNYIWKEHYYCQYWVLWKSGRAGPCPHLPPFIPSTYRVHV